MKQIKIFTLILLAVVVQSCLKDDKENFSISASARIEARLLENGETLKNADNGWLMKIYPESNQIYGGSNILVKFEDNSKVTVMSERGGASKTESSMFSLIADNGPVISFDTYNELFHYFSEPFNPDGIGPIDGGMLGDYEFVILEATKDKVVLKGKKTNNKIIMTPIPANQSWENAMKEFLDTDLATRDYSAYEYMVKDFKAYVVRDFRNLFFTYNEGGKEKSKSIGYIVTKDGIEFYEPLNLGGVEVSSMIFHYDPESPYFEDEVTGAKLNVVAPPLSRLIVNGKWYFSKKNMGAYGQKYWTEAYEEKMKPKDLIMHSIFLGRDNNVFGISYMAAKEGMDPIPGMYNYNYEIVDDNTFRTYWNGTGSGTYVVYGFLYKMNYVIHPISNSPKLEREFKLSTDDILKPSWIYMEDIEDPTNTFKLFKDVVVEPFLN